MRGLQLDFDLLVHLLNFCRKYIRVFISVYFYGMKTKKFIKLFEGLVLQFYSQEPSKITLKIMRHINFSKVTLVSSYMSQYFNFFFLLFFVCPVMHFEDSAPETNKMSEHNSH